jgi:hypothetical protein
MCDSQATLNDALVPRHDHARRMQASNMITIPSCYIVIFVSLINLISSILRFISGICEAVQIFWINQNMWTQIDPCCVVESIPWLHSDHQKKVCIASDHNLCRCSIIYQAKPPDDGQEDASSRSSIATELFMQPRIGSIAAVFAYLACRVTKQYLDEPNQSINLSIYLSIYIDIYIYIFIVWLPKRNWFYKARYPYTHAWY